MFFLISKQQEAQTHDGSLFDISVEDEDSQYCNCMSLPIGWCWSECKSLVCTWGDFIHPEKPPDSNTLRLKHDEEMQHSHFLFVTSVLK